MQYTMLIIYFSVAEEPERSHDCVVCKKQFGHEVDLALHHCREEMTQGQGCEVDANQNIEK